VGIDCKRELSGDLRYHDRRPRRFSNSSLHFFCTGPLLPQAKNPPHSKKNWRDPATEVSYEHHQLCLRLTIEPGKSQSIPSINPGTYRDRDGIGSTTSRATSGRLAWGHQAWKIKPHPLHHRTIRVAGGWGTTDTDMARFFPIW
jgi:hypothetical protein